MACGTRQIIPPPFACVRPSFTRFTLKPYKQRNPRGACLLNTLQPVKQCRLAGARRVHNLVARVEAATRTEHGVVANVLAVLANRRNGTNIDLPGIGVAKRRSDAVIRQQNRLPAPGTVKAAVGH